MKKEMIVPAMGTTLPRRTPGMVKEKKGLKPGEEGEFWVLSCSTRSGEEVGWRRSRL